METWINKDFHSTCILAVILAVGIFLRTRRIGRKGVFTWDEAAYCRESGVVKVIIRFVSGNFRELLELRRRPDPERRAAIVDRYRNSFVANYAFYKCLHAYTILAARRFCKTRDIAICLPAQFSGALAMLAVYLLGAMAFGKPVGLLAAAFLALSGLHTLHSRSAGPESEMALAFTASLVFSVAHKYFLARNGADFLYSPQSLLLLTGCGVSLGALIMLHTIWFAIVPAMVLCAETAFALSSGIAPFPFLIISLFIIYATMTACVLVLDLPFIACWLLLPESGIVPHSYKALQNIAKELKRARDMSGKDKKGKVKLPLTRWHLFYPMLLLKSDGAAIVAAVFCGMVLLAARHGSFDVFVLVLAAMYLGFMTVVPWRAARGMVVFLPMLMLLAAVAVHAVPAPALFVVLAWIAARGAVYAWKVGSLTSGIRRAVDFIESHGGGGFTCTCAPFASVYGAEGVVPFIPCNYEVISMAMEKLKIKYLIVEHHKLYPGFIRDGAIEMIQQHFTPVFTAEDPVVTFPPLFMEVEYLFKEQFSKSIRLDKWNDFWAKPSENDKTVWVYDLEDFFSKLDENSPLACALFAQQAENLMEKGDIKEATLFLKNAKRKHPKDSKITYLLGMCYLSSGRHNWAIRQLKEALELGGLEGKEYTESLVAVKTVDAQNFMDKGLFMEALVALEEALKHKPDDCYLIVNKGICCQNLGRMDITYNLYSELLKSDKVPVDMRDALKSFVALYEKRAGIRREDSPES